MKLFKYYPPERKDVLCTRLVCLTQPGALNDPFEVRPIATCFKLDLEIEAIFEGILEKEMPKYYSTLPQKRKTQLTIDQFRAIAKPAIMNQFMQFGKKAVNNMAQTFGTMIPAILDATMGIFCLSKPRDNLLMWAHYAQEHQGFALGFDAQNEFFNQCGSDDPSEWGHLFEVKYSEKRPSGAINDFRDFSRVSTKGLTWKHEEEWRLVLPLHEADTVILQNPYNIHLFRFPPEALVEIVLGARADDEPIIKLIRCNRKIHHAKIYKAVPSPDEFGLEFKEMDI